MVMTNTYTETTGNFSMDVSWTATWNPNDLNYSLLVGVHLKIDDVITDDTEKSGTLTINGQTYNFTYSLKRDAPDVISTEVYSKSLDLPAKLTDVTTLVIESSLDLTVDGITNAIAIPSTTDSIDKPDVLGSITQVSPFTVTQNKITYTSSVVSTSNKLTYSIGLKFNDKVIATGDNNGSLPVSVDNNKSIIASPTSKMYLVITTTYSGSSLGSKSTEIKYITPDKATLVGSDFTVLSGMKFSITGSLSTVTYKIRMIADTGSGILSAVANNVFEGTNQDYPFSTYDNGTILKYLVGKSSDKFHLELIGTYNDVKACLIKSPTYTVTSLPAATTSALKFEAGLSPTMKINGISKDTHYTYKFIMTLNDFNKQWPNLPIDTSDVPTAFSNSDIENIFEVTKSTKEYTKGTLDLYTYYDGTQIRVPSTVNVTITVQNADPSLTDSFYWKDLNAKTVAMTQDNTLVVQGYSDISVTIPRGSATGAKHADIIKFSIDYDGKVDDINYDSNDITIHEGTTSKSSLIKIKVTVTDSRGYTTSRSKSFTPLSYSKPTVDKNEITRESNFYVDTNINLQGTFEPVRVGGVARNKITGISYRTKSSNGSWTDFKELKFSTVTNLFLAITSIQLDNTTDWNIEVAINDMIETTSLSVTLTAPSPLLFIDLVNKSVGINQYPKHSNSLEIKGDIYINDVKLSLSDNSTLSGQVYKLNENVDAIIKGIALLAGNPFPDDDDDTSTTTTKP